MTVILPSQENDDGDDDQNKVDLIHFLNRTK